MPAVAVTVADPTGAGNAYPRAQFQESAGTHEPRLCKGVRAHAHAHDMHMHMHMHADCSLPLAMAAACPADGASSPQLRVSQRAARGRPEGGTLRG